MILRVSTTLDPTQFQVTVELLNEKLEELTKQLKLPQDIVEFYASADISVTKVRRLLVRTFVLPQSQGAQ